MTTVKRILYDRPWLLVVFGIGTLMATTIAFVVIAVCNPPQLIGS